MWREDCLAGLLGDDSFMPYGFLYEGENSDEWRSHCVEEREHRPIPGGEIREYTYICEDGFRLTAALTVFNEYPAAELELRLENRGLRDSGLVEGIMSARLQFPEALQDGSFLLHCANGAPSSPEDFFMRDQRLYPGTQAQLGGRGGRSSSGDLPFFHLDTARGTALFGVGWAGQWQATFRCSPRGLELCYGLEQSRFRLHPGEAIRLPSLLMMFWEGDRSESHSAFRRLIFERYMPRLEGRNGDPYLFCNTCFTRYGNWLNECNEENQISLIHALEPLGAECVIVDAGWFEGGWPEGAGNWDADPEKYPHGMEHMADVARRSGMKYGLWFELERVVGGTDLARRHPEWLLSAPLGVQQGWSRGHHLLNMGLREARDYALSIVERYLSIENFSAYRQDFNVDPLEYWRAADEPERIGMTEVLYLNGLNEFLDTIRERHPDCFMDGCASGGRRIDLDMIRRFHTHQKSDFWFNARVDQNSLFSLSHYLPCTCVTTHLNRMDDYSVDSELAATLCLGWIADAPDFPGKQALRQIQRYHRVRPLLNDQFYPLTAFDGTEDGVMASQYHDRAAAAGVVFLFLREDHFMGDLPPIRLHAIREEARYGVECLNDGTSRELSGAELKSALPWSLASTHGYSSVYYYRELP